jgi:hypothetical protein
MTGICVLPRLSPKEIQLRLDRDNKQVISRRKRKREAAADLREEKENVVDQSEK